MSMPVNTPSAFGALRRRLDHWHRLLQTRRELSRMPARLLVDIGLSPEMVARTADAPFWQPLGQDLELQPGLEPAPGAARELRRPALPLGFAAVERLAAAVYPNRP